MVDEIKETVHTVEHPDQSPKIIEHEGRLTKTEMQLTQQAENFQRDIASMEERLATAIAEGNKSAVNDAMSRIDALETRLVEIAIKLEELKPAKAVEETVETPATVVNPPPPEEPNPPKKEYHGFVGRKAKRKDGRGK